jgi:hypothetical protein
MKIPCVECIVFVACKVRENERCKFMIDEMYGTGVFELADRERCLELSTYLEGADIKEVNQVRELFGMEII